MKQVNKQEIKMEQKRREQELAEQTFQLEIKRKEEQEVGYLTLIKKNILFF